MSRKRKALTLETHNVSKVFVSKEYLGKLGIMDRVLEAAKTDNFAGVYEALIKDALETEDTNLVKMVTGEHIISVNADGITFESIESIKVPSSPE
jgi:hypothetical protein